jgi:hypothetical protein
MTEMPQTQKKLREAHFFLWHLQAKSWLLPTDNAEEFEFFLSAFLSAARSVYLVLLQCEGQSRFSRWFDEWERTCCEQERRLLDFMRVQRNQEQHQRGADVSPIQKSIPYWDYLWIVEARRPTRGNSAIYGYQPFGPFGLAGPPTEHPITTFTLGTGPDEAAETCRHYLALLDRMVKEFMATPASL